MEQPRTCIVLYDSSSEYGIQIITADTVEDVLLGNDTSFEESTNSYNEAIDTLNKKSNRILK